MPKKRPDIVDELTIDELAQKVIDMESIDEDISKLNIRKLKDLVNDTTGRIRTLVTEFADTKHSGRAEYGLKAGSLLTVRASLKKELERKNLLIKILNIIIRK
jgi:hypothetical protein